MPRKSFDIKDKRSAVQKIDALVSAGFSQHQACLGVGIPPLYYRRWVKVLKKVDVMNAGDEYVSNKTMEQLAEFTQAERVFLLE